MRTPREIPLARHAGAVEKLDAMREKIVADMARAARKPKSRGPATLGEFLLSLRWHAAAMGAAWVLVLLLARETVDGTRGAAAERGNAPAPLVYFTALRECRRELAELNEAPVPPPLRPVPHAFAPPRRREGEIDAIA